MLSVLLQVTSGTSDYIPHLPVGSFRNWKKNSDFYYSPSLVLTASYHLSDKENVTCIFFNYRRKEKQRDTTQTNTKNREKRSLEGRGKGRIKRKKKQGQNAEK